MTDGKTTEFRNVREHIRMARPEDAQTVYGIMMEASRTMANPEWFLTDTEEYVREMAAGVRGSYILLMETDGQASGFLIVEAPRPDDDSYTRYVPGANTGNSMYPISTAVLPAFRGRGIQRRLYLKAEEIERKKGTKFLLATVHPDNKASLNSILRAGYEIAVTTDQIYEGKTRHLLVRVPGAPRLNVVLLEPEIPANTGNIGRTCMVTGSRLHLIGPLGFRLGEKEQKRAGLDYWQELDVTTYLNFEDFLKRNPHVPMYFATTKARKKYTDASYEPEAFLIFGKESAGIPEEILMRYPDRCVRIPMVGDSRSLNLSNAAAIVLYEALRQNDFAGMRLQGQLHRHVWAEENGQV